MNHRPEYIALKETYLQQLISLRDEKDLFLGAYFPEFGSRRTQVEKLLSSYTSMLEKLLERPTDEWRDIVLIGCGVTVTYMDDGMTESFTIVFPEEAQPDSNRISFYSPIAEQLLMRSCGDLVSMNTSMDTYQVRIDRIWSGVDNIEEERRAAP
ncbi:GreA/GreB family elongation factor [Paenibacillus sp. NPDC057967]|uniref:GreA/GreB family elongation factor n=1 Tax=Paenibacillus sp. NPDC057967 TaxID=3346293 RepID=UPI0036D76234